MDRKIILEYIKSNNVSINLKIIFIILSTGLLTWLISYILLVFGVKLLYIRYTISIIITYVYFLIILKLLLISLKNDFITKINISKIKNINIDSNNIGKTYIIKHYFNKISNLIEMFSFLDELLIPILTIFLGIIGIIFFISFLFVSLPIILIELLTSEIILFLYYKRINKIIENNFQTDLNILKLTLVPFIIILVLFLIWGFILQYLYPNYNSFWKIFIHLFK